MKELKFKQEKFCKAYIEYADATKAYRSVYDVEGKNANATQVEAHRLSKEPHIVARIQELKEMHAERHKLTVDDLLKELEEARQVALTGEKQQPAAAVAATMGKAKMLGYDKQIIDLTSSDGTMASKPTMIELIAPNVESKD